tara:strand:+ start:8124 stop:8348 length:225 start_codon:yes stop_codon:yes gene_type:complete
MSNNIPKILRITNMKWLDQDKSKDKLPSEVQLQWVNEKWDNIQVMRWLNDHFNASLKELSINQLDDVESKSESG